MKKFMFSLLITLFLISTENARCVITIDISEDDMSGKKYNTITVDFEDSKPESKAVVEKSKLVSEIESLGAGPKNKYGISSIHFYNYKDNEDVGIIQNVLAKLYTRKFLNKDISMHYDAHSSVSETDKKTFKATLDQKEREYQSAVLNQ